MSIETFEEFMRRLSSGDENADARVALFMEAGLNPEQAQRAEAIFRETVDEVMMLIGRKLDIFAGDDKPLGGLVADYYFNGVVANITAMQDYILENRFRQALSEGTVLAVVMGRPDCDCSACRAKRVTEEALSGTRH